MTTDGARIFVSDGSSRISVWDPGSLLRGRARESAPPLVARRDDGTEVTRLNELEWACGEILANVWMTDTIVRLDAATGRVLGEISLRGLNPRARPGHACADGPRDEGEGCFNGLAYDAEAGTLLATGKNWSTLYALVLPSVDRDGARGPWSAHRKAEGGTDAEGRA
jgi:glutamine cyclotransferase